MARRVAKTGKAGQGKDLTVRQIQPAQPGSGRQKKAARSAPFASMTWWTRLAQPLIRPRQQGDMPHFSWPAGFGAFRSSWQFGVLDRS